MSSRYKTTHGLNHWVEEDVPSMHDLNDDNRLIDQHLAFSYEFEIGEGDWEASEYLAYPWQAVIRLEKVTEGHDAQVLFDAQSVARAMQVGIANGFGATKNGTVVMFAVDKCADRLRGACIITQREEVA